MTFEDYKKIEAVNASFLKACSFGAYQGFKYLHDKPFESDAMNFGSAVHSALLEPELFKNEYVITPKFDKRTKAGKEGAAQFELENAGKAIISDEDYYKILKIKERCHAIDIVKEALTNFEKEKTYLWNHPTVGKMKARLDLVDEKNGVVIDVKTTRSANMREFSSQIVALAYDIQMLHYSYAISKNAACYVIAIESDSAEVALYDITDIVHSSFTAMRYEQAMNTALDVLHMTECPPKFKPEIINLSLPKWAESESV